MINSTIRNACKEEYKASYEVVRGHLLTGIEAELKRLDGELKAAQDPTQQQALALSKGKMEAQVFIKTLTLMTSKAINTEEEEDMLVINTCFAPWREAAFEIWQDTMARYEGSLQADLLLYFIQKVDFEVLPLFAKRVRERYASLVNVYNFGLKPESGAFLGAKNNPLYRTLVKAVCKWLVNLELISDWIDRLKLYGLVDYSQCEQILKCKSKWKPSGGRQHIRHVLKTCSWNMAIEIQSKLSSTIVDLLKSFAIGHFPLTLAFGFGFLRQLTIGTAVTSVITYPAIGYFATVIGGLLMVLMMNLAKGQLEGHKAVDDVRALIASFQTTNMQLADLFRQAGIHVLTAAASQDATKKTAAIDSATLVLDMLTTKKKPVYGYQAIEPDPVPAASYVHEYFKTKPVEDDWLHITAFKIEEAKVKEDLEGSVTSLSLLPPEPPQGKK